MVEFSEDQIGKRVVAQSGSVVGDVTDVRDGHLHVTVAPDADQDVVDNLNWEGTVNQETHELDGRYVSTVTDTTVRLRV